MNVIRQHLPLAVGLASLVAVISMATPAHAQFGREYLRYSMYGSGPYGYGTQGYRKVVTPESPAFENTRVLESDYGYDPPRKYEGTLPTTRIPEHPLPSWQHVPWY